MKHASKPILELPLIPHAVDCGSNLTKILKKLYTSMCVCNHQLAKFYF